MTVPTRTILEIPQIGLGEALGRGLQTGLEAGLQTSLQAFLTGQAQRQKQEQDVLRAQLLGQQAGLTPEQAAILTPGDISQLIRSQAEAAKAEARAGEFQQKRAESAFKITAPVRKEINKGAQTARDVITRLDRMDQLVGRGKLINPLFNEGLKKLGLDIPALKNPDSQEFEKLSADLTRDAREAYGARITNFELDIFLKSIPTLNQSEEGKRRIIRNRVILEQGKEVKARNMRQIIQENGGVPPLDLGEQIEERSAPELNRLADEFKVGLEEIERTDAVPPQVSYTEGEKFDQMPPAVNAPGVTIRDTKTGRLFRSNGRTWQEVKR